jgi:putative hydrolase of the HAD superfamily
MITNILFDLDNTLYSARYGLEDKVSRRVADFLSARLGLPWEQALALRRERIKNYGTTMEWLRSEMGFTDINSYYAAIHPEGEEDALPPDPALGSFLQNLNLPLAVLTNSPREHADRILKKLGITDLFTYIFDIRWNGLKGKPQPDVFKRALEAMGSGPEETLFIDDFPSYVEGYLAIGGKGLLLDEFGEHRDYPHERIQNLRELTAFL